MVVMDVCVVADVVVVVVAVAVVVRDVCVCRRRRRYNDVSNKRFRIEK